MIWLWLILSGGLMLLAWATSESSLPLAAIWTGIFGISSIVCLYKAVTSDPGPKQISRHEIDGK